jgi:hypothetical protein
MSATSFAVASAAISVASSVAKSMGDYGEAKRQEKIAKYNAAVTEEKIKSLNYEEAMNETLRRLNAYEEIGSGKNYMGSRGNVGSSADSAVINAYMNLAGDLSAMSFNYENRRVDLKTERNNYLYQSKVAESQKKAAIMSGVLGVGGTLMQGYRDYSLAGGKYGYNSKYWDVASYYDEYGNLQYTFHRGLFSSTFGNETKSNWEKAIDAGRAYYTTNTADGAVIPGAWNKYGVVGKRG